MITDRGVNKVTNGGQKQHRGHRTGWSRDQNKRSAVSERQMTRGRVGYEIAQLFVSGNPSVSRRQLCAYRQVRTLIAVSVSGYDP